MGPTSASEWTYTVVSCHFGDPFWIKHTLERLNSLSDDRIHEVIVVDQSRASHALLTSLPRVSHVITFPPDEDQIAVLGHDHPAALNRALSTIDFQTSHIMVLDSDCFPISATWLDALHEVTVAADPVKWGLSHPCLMTFPAALRNSVDYAEGLLEVGIDTGRLVGLQLARAGVNVWFTAARDAFDGYRGHYYLDQCVYHHGSASFVSSRDPRLSTKVSAPQEDFFRHKVAQGDFALSRFERGRLDVRRALKRASRPSQKGSLP